MPPPSGSTDMSFDPYYTWLGIPPHEQPPHYYRLLGVQLFEPNDEVIDNAADRQMAHVRSFQTGPHSADSQRLLTAIATARVTLLDSARRADYDAQLQQVLHPPAFEQPRPVLYPNSPYGPAATPQPYYPGPSYYPSPAPQPYPTPMAQPVSIPSPYPPAAPVSVPVPVPVPVQVAAAPAVVSVEVPAPKNVPSDGAASATSTDGSLFTANSTRSTLATRRRRGRNATTEVIKIVAGGVVGLGIGAAVLSYGLGVNPLGKNSTTPPRDETKRPTEPGGHRPSSVPSTIVSKNSTPTSDERPESTATSDPRLVKAQGNSGDTPATTAARASLMLEYRRPERGAPPGQLRADLRLVNRGQSPVDLEKLTLRYWYKGTAQPKFWCDSSSLGAGRVTYRFITLEQPVSSASGFCEVGFRAGAGPLDVDPQGISLTIRMTSADNGPLDSSGDHSDLATASSFREADRITIYQDGKLVRGVEPAGLAGRQIVVSGDNRPEVARPFADDSRTGGFGPRVVRQRLAVPGEDLLAQASTAVEGVFRTTDKRSRTERVELARRMQKTALEADERPAEQYVLLNRGAEIAQTCGEPNLVVELVDRLGERFEIDAPLLRQKLLLKTMVVINDEAHLQQAVSAARVTIFDLILDEHYDEALKLADGGVDLCREPIGKNQRKFVTDGRNSLRALHLQWKEFLKARKTLDEQPDDPAANAVAGRWLCLQVDDWNAGLTHLTRGADTRLAEVAQADLATADTSEAQQATADKWYDLCQGSATYNGYSARALHWYDKPLPKASGLERVKIEQRVKELREQVSNYDKTTFGRRALRELRPPTRSF